jgi:CheY-like chemotaxis protein
MQEKKHILCVEDNPVNQKLMNTFLASYPQVIVCTAGSAEQALQRLEQQSFDLILMDINLPEMDGISLTSKIRKLEEPHASTPIIAISAVAIANTVEDVGDLFEAYLTKPVDFDQLKVLLQRYLD